MHMSYDSTLFFVYEGPFTPVSFAVIFYAFFSFWRIGCEDSYRPRTFVALPHRSEEKIAPKLSAQIARENEPSNGK